MFLEGSLHRAKDSCGLDEILAPIDHYQSNVTGFPAAFHFIMIALFGSLFSV